MHVVKHRCSTQTLARVSRPRLSSPSHHPDEADDPPRDQPFARAHREACGTSRTPLAQRDQPLVKLDSRCEPSRAPRDRGIRPRPTARSRWTIPPGTNHSRARREAYTQPRPASARWPSKDRTESRFASLNRRRDRPRPPEMRAGPQCRTEATRNSHSRAGGGQNHIDLGSDACMSASFLSSTSAPSAHESPGARIERTHLWARSK